MPYIKQEDRVRLKALPVSIMTAGELNYTFTKSILDYIAMNGTSYQIFNDIIGALEGAKLEFYRRVVADYEDGKITQNGDVY